MPCPHREKDAYRPVSVTGPDSKPFEIRIMLNIRFVHDR